VEPVLAEADFQESKRIAAKFLEAEGPLLQERLVRWCENPWLTMSIILLKPWRENNTRLEA
jgi:hypothetical protein